MRRVLKIVGWIVGIFIVLVIIAAIFGTKDGASSTAAPSQPAPADTATASGTASVSAPTSPASDASTGPEAALAGEMPDMASATNVGTDWPTVAVITLSQSPEEKQYLAHRSCIEDAAGGCDGPKRFARFIYRKYPDIARVRYEPDTVDADDPDMAKLRKEQFVHGLYFAKQIRLANGKTLYDFIRSCSNGFVALDGAEGAYEDKTQQPYFDLRYFVTLRRIGNEQPVELQLLFERRGDQVIAGSPFFSSDALRAPDFLQRHHVACWPRSTNDS